MNIIIEALNFSFFTRALAMGSILALICGLIGTFVVMRKEALIGHAVSNTLFAGIAIGLLVGINMNLVTIIAGIVAVLFITFLQRVQQFSTDSLLEFVSQLSMALAIFFISFIQGIRIDILQFLFGDILAISNEDILVGGILAALIFFTILFFKRKLLQIAISPELALSSGTNVNRYNFLFTSLIVFTIAVGIKIVGIILLSAFLIIPANSAKLLARNFNQMLLISTVIAIIGTVTGLFASYIFNVPSGAMIILCLSGVLILATIYKLTFQKNA